MKTISPEVLKGIEPELEIVNRCILDAVRHYQERLGDESAKHCALTKASYIRDQILENITKEFFGNPIVAIMKKRGMITLAFYTEPIIILKFKKFDKYNRVCSTRTTQSYMYSNQYNLFEELTRTINLHAGYKWNETETAIECIIGLPNSERDHAWTVVLQNKSLANELTGTKTLHTEEIKPKVKLKVKEIRKKNEQAS